jgi:hypothetical protein
VADSFILNAQALVSTIDFTVWTGGGPISTLNWAITTNPFDNTAIVASGTASPTNTFDQAISPNGSDFNIYSETLDTAGVNLAAGVTYWLQLSGAEQTDADAGSAVVYWDENDGTSQAYASGIGSLADYTCSANCGQSGSETFDVNGTTTPEPGTVTLLFSGLLFTGGAARYRRKRAS